MLGQSKSKKDIAAETARILLDTQSVLVDTENPFTYSSGATGPVYVDCRRLISFVKERRKLMQFAGRLLADCNIDYVAGGETAGIPYGAFLSEEIGKPMLYVRKKAKGFGRMAQIEGHFDHASQPRILLVEDLQRDGGSKVPFVNALREAGGIVEDTFVIFHYGNSVKSEQTMSDLGVRLHALCTWEDILQFAEREKRMDAKAIDAVRTYLQESAKAA